MQHATCQSSRNEFDVEKRILVVFGSVVTIQIFVAAIIAGMKRENKSKSKHAHRVKKKKTNAEAMGFRN